MALSLPPGDSPTRSDTIDATPSPEEAEWPAAGSRRAMLAAGGTLGAAAAALGAARLLIPGVRSAHAQAVVPPLSPAPAPPLPPAAVEAAGAPTPPAAAGSTLRILPLLAPEAQNGVKTFNLALQQGQFQFMPERPAAATLGINGSYLGPVLRARQGDAVAANVVNRIGQATTLHWHGMHLPAAMDGGPHQMIAEGSTWRPRFTIRQEAATLWLHAHMMGLTREHVSRGLASMFILDDDNPAQAALPRTYGVDDLPLIFQDDVFDGRFPFGGGAPILVNGSHAPTFATAQPRLRLRLLNAASNRFLVLGFAGDRPFHQIASDGGLLPAPVPMTRLQIGPAERAEIVVDVTDQLPGQPVELQSFRGFGNPEPTTVLSIVSTATAADAADVAPLPARLNEIERLDPATAAVTRDLVLGGGGGVRTINGHAMASMADMHDMAATMRVRLGEVELWNVINTTRQTHIFHVHDVQFQIVDRSSRPLAPNELGRKDTVVVGPFETVRILMRFADYADAETPYMFHCHILQHEDQGMMGQFVVFRA